MLIDSEKYRESEKKRKYMNNISITRSVLVLGKQAHYSNKKIYYNTKLFYFSI
jgi:hypothetical protein